MLRQRRTPWPAELGPNNPAARARTIARGYRGLSAKWAARFATADPADVPSLAAQFGAELAALDAMADRFGEAVWLLPAAETRAPEERLTRQQVADRAGVSGPAVTRWGTCGLAIGPNGVRVHLRPGTDGRYDPDAVDEFLHLRDTDDPGPSNPGPAEHVTRGVPA